MALKAQVDSLRQEIKHFIDECRTTRMEKDLKLEQHRRDIESETRSFRRQCEIFNEEHKKRTRVGIVRDYEKDVSLSLVRTNSDSTLPSDSTEILEDEEYTDKLNNRLKALRKNSLKCRDDIRIQTMAKLNRVFQEFNPSMKVDPNLILMHNRTN